MSKHNSYILDIVNEFWGHADNHLSRNWIAAVYSFSHIKAIIWGE